MKGTDRPRSIFKNGVLEHEKYFLAPCATQNQQSFYNKAYVIEDDGEKTLYSYDTKIMTVKGGTMYRHLDEWSHTTGKHIFAFCGMRKADFLKLPLC